jgi:hypothetical protein
MILFATIYLKRLEEKDVIAAQIKGTAQLLMYVLVQKVGQVLIVKLQYAK